MSTTITAPAKIPGKAASYFGPHLIEFEDGVATFEGDLSGGLLAYLLSSGYTVDGESVEQPEADPVPDARDHDLPEFVGTGLRDAAVDPRPGDFLAPTNAGEANPHGPTVVSPGVHAVGPGPIVPGTVGSADYQDAKETATAEAVLVDQSPVGEVTSALGAIADREYAVTAADGTAVEVANLDESDVDTAIKDGEPEPLKGAALDQALDAAGLSKAGTVAEKRTRLADHQADDQGQA